MVWLILLLALNFAISWHNAASVGHMWSESKVIGGSIRVLAIAGYAMAIGGFTMVYGCVLLLISPYIVPLIWPSFPVAELIALSGDMMYLLVAAFILPSGVVIWFHSAVRFWRRRTLGTGLNLAWNSYAQVRNTVNAARSIPGAFGRVSKALFGGRGRKKGNAVVVLLAVFLLIIALCGGWFTASAILKRADLAYDGLAEFEPAQG